MTPSKPDEYLRPPPPRDRTTPPHACVADSKRHLRTFLIDALEDLGFVTSACAEADDIAAILDTHVPDLIVLGLTVDGIEIGKILETLVSRTYTGQILIVGPRDSIMVRAVRKLGAEYGLAMLPPLSTPFSAGKLHESVRALLPMTPTPRPAVNVSEALRAGWFEMTYQRKVGAHSLAPCGAEASVRLHHPHWGVVSPDCFVHSTDDPYFRALSEFAIVRAMEDWRYLLKQQGPVDLSVNLPVAFLRDPNAVNDLCRWIPAQAEFSGLLIELDSAEALHHLDLLADTAKRLRPHKIALSIDGLGVEWPALMHLDAFPFVEIKVGSEFVTGCSDDRLKQTVCRHIIELARGCGARITATGVDSRSDYLTAYELGFDLVQGYLFGKPVGVKKFGRASLARITSTSP